MLGVIYVQVNSKCYLITIYKCVGKVEYYIYKINETYVKVVNHYFRFSSAIS